MSVVSANSVQACAQSAEHGRTRRDLARARKNLGVYGVHSCHALQIGCALIVNLYSIVALISTYFNIHSSQGTTFMPAGEF